MSEPVSGAAIDGVLLSTLDRGLKPLSIALSPEALGRGTFSIVYRAIISGDNAAAVKCMHGLYSGNLYRKESMLAAEVASCGGGLPLLNVAALSTAPVMVTPHVQARSFTALVRSASLDEVRRYMRALLLDLSVVHACGIVHRDVKPKNFVYDFRTGVGWLTDFGLADTQETLAKRLQKKLAAAKTQQVRALASLDGGRRPMVGSDATGFPAGHSHRRQGGHLRRGIQATGPAQSATLDGNHRPRTASTKRGGTEDGGLAESATGLREPKALSGFISSVPGAGSLAVPLSPTPSMQPSQKQQLNSIVPTASAFSAPPLTSSTLTSEANRERDVGEEAKIAAAAEEYSKVSLFARKESLSGKLLDLLPGGPHGCALEIIFKNRVQQTQQEGTLANEISGSSSSTPQNINISVERDHESEGLTNFTNKREKEGDMEVEEGEEEEVSETEKAAEAELLRSRLQKLNLALRDCFVGLPCYLEGEQSLEGSSESTIGESYQEIPRSVFPRVDKEVGRVGDSDSRSGEGGRGSLGGVDGGEKQLLSGGGFTHATPPSAMDTEENTRDFGTATYYSSSSLAGSSDQLRAPIPTSMAVRSSVGNFTSSGSAGSGGTIITSNDISGNNNTVAAAVFTGTINAPTTSAVTTTCSNNTTTTQKNSEMNNGSGIFGDCGTQPSSLSSQKQKDMGSSLYFTAPNPPSSLDIKHIECLFPPHPWGLLPPSLPPPTAAPPFPPHHNSISPPGSMHRLDVSAREVTREKERRDAVLDADLAPQAADRAGTPGFRAPEVLLSSLQQDTSLDVWSAGIVLLSLLTRRYPVLPGRSDEEQLITLTQLMRDSLRYSSALSLGKELVEIPFCSLFRPVAGGLASLVGASRYSEPGFQEAFNLLLACLDPDPLRRISAAAALTHPFFSHDPSPSRDEGWVTSDSTPTPSSLTPASMTTISPSVFPKEEPKAPTSRIGVGFQTNEKLKATMATFLCKISTASAPAAATSQTQAPPREGSGIRAAVRHDEMRTALVLSERELHASTPSHTSSVTDRGYKSRRPEGATVEALQVNAEAFLNDSQGEDSGEETSSLSPNDHERDEEAEVASQSRRESSSQI